MDGIPTIPGEHKVCELVDLKYVSENTAVLLYKECKE